MSETVADIVREIRELDDDEIDVAINTRELLDYLARIESANRRTEDELARQREYDAKLESDFAALMADRNDLAEKNRACCAENERLLEALRDRANIAAASLAEEREAKALAKAEGANDEN